MSRWILIAIIILNIYIFLNVSNTSRIEMTRTVFVTLPAQVGGIVHGFTMKIEELK